MEQSAPFIFSQGFFPNVEVARFPEGRASALGSAWFPDIVATLRSEAIIDSFVDWGLDIPPPWFKNFQGFLRHILQTGCGLDCISCAA